MEPILIPKPNHTERKLGETKIYEPLIVSKIVHRKTETNVFMLEVREGGRIRFETGLVTERGKVYFRNCSQNTRHDHYGGRFQTK